MDEWICDRVGNTDSAGACSFCSASVIRDIGYKRQVSGKRQLRKLEDGKRIPHDLRERQPEDTEIIYLGSKIKPDLELRQK